VQPAAGISAAALSAKVDRLSAQQSQQHKQLADGLQWGEIDIRGSLEPPGPLPTHLHTAYMK
jgi:hypothetical protein